MKKYILLSFLVGLMACSDTYDGVFEQSPDERTEAVLNEYKEVLLEAENGWLFNYYPRPADLGGFTFVMKFAEDGNVKMNWSIRDEEQTALYSLKMVDKPLLIFDTYSIFSKFADPEIAMGGENELAFVRISADRDTIYMEERLKKDPVTLVRASATAWGDIKLYPAQMRVLQRVEEKVVPFYYTLNVEGWESPVLMTYYDNRQVMTLFYREDGENKHLTMGMNYTKDGFQFHKPFTLNGISVRSFRYDADKNEHVVTDNGVDGKFTYQATCPVVVDGLAELLFSPGKFGDNSCYASPKAQEIFGEMAGVHKFQGLFYSPYGGFFSDLSLSLGDGNIKFDSPNYIVTGENTIRIEAAETYSSYYYTPEQLQEMVSTDAAKLVREYVLSQDGWTLVPCYFENEYNRYFYLISNKNPEVYFAYGDMY